MRNKVREKRGACERPSAEERGAQGVTDPGALGYRGP